ncbi:MAG: hypothetical protein WDK96_02355 [Candidatus Paceibacterota bacterium]|jgi:hypothetical protein
MNIILERKLFSGPIYKIVEDLDLILSVTKGSKTLKLNHKVMDRTKREGLIIHFYLCNTGDDEYSVCVVFDDEQNKEYTFKIDDLDPLDSD